MKSKSSVRAPPDDPSLRPRCYFSLFGITGLTFLVCAELLISSYYNIVKRTMIDMVPKAIMLNLVQYAADLAPNPPRAVLA